ncbi:MAG: hypothetical protein MI924_33655 [Chloroflexales bacterium]|nr:hypothetical protein [Chloroflexales bacterium]
MQQQFRRLSLLLAVSFVMVILLAVLAMWAGADRHVVTISASLIDLVLLILLVYNISASRRISNDVQEILAGAHWAHWRYDPLFWEQHAPSTWFNRSLRFREQSLPSRLGRSALVALLLAGMSFLIAQRGGTTTQAIQVAVIVGFAMLALTMTSTYFAWQRLQQIEAMEAVDVYVSPVGIYTTDQPMHLLRLRHPEMRLSNVTIQPGNPAFLAFEAQYRPGSKGKPIASTICLPIPQGQQEEAEELIIRFRLEAIDEA